MCVSMNNRSLRYGYKTALSSKRATAKMKMKLSQMKPRGGEGERGVRGSLHVGKTGGMRQEEA